MTAGKTADVQERLRRMAGDIVGLPTLPTMLDRLNRLVNDPRTSAQDVAKLISSDPALTSKVLKVVNSSFYGVAHRIATVSHAIVILGFNTVRHIVLGTSIFDLFRDQRGSDVFDHREFWRHSVGCGAAARATARLLKLPQTEELFIAGLLHDLGKIVADVHFHDSFDKAVRAAAERDVLLLETERELLGVTHAEVGALLLERWNLAPGLVDAVRCHHNPVLAEEPNQRAAAVVHLADILARALRFGSGGDRRIPCVSDHAWGLLGFALDDMDRLVAAAGEEMEKAAVILDFLK